MHCLYKCMPCTSPQSPIANHLWVPHCWAMPSCGGVFSVAFPRCFFYFAASLLLPAPYSSLLQLFGDEKALWSLDCALPGSWFSPAQVDTHLWVCWRDLQVKCCPSVLCLNLRALGLAQQCHISKGFRDSHLPQCWWGVCGFIHGVQCTGVSSSKGRCQA